MLSFSQSLSNYFYHLFFHLLSSIFPSLLFFTIAKKFISKDFEPIFIPFSFSQSAVRAYVSNIFVNLKVIFWTILPPFKFYIYLRVFLEQCLVNSCVLLNSWNKKRIRERGSKEEKIINLLKHIIFSPVHENQIIASLYYTLMIFWVIFILNLA